MLDNLFKTYDMNIDHAIEYDEQQGTYSDSDDDVLMNMDEIDGVGITLQ